MKNIFFILLLFVMAIVVSVYLLFKSHRAIDIKCQGFVQYNFFHNDSILKYDLLESVFLSKKQSSIIFHGFMYKNGKHFNLERKISFSEPERIDSDTISINLISFSKTTNDEIIDDDFRRLLSNIGFIGDNLRLDLNEIRDGSYLLGNSTSYNFICTPYY